MYNCPCCGNPTYPAPPKDDIGFICGICWWENDPFIQSDDEPATVALMHEFMEQQGYVLDITDQRFHHEIYLGDARKAAPERLKTVIRHPIRLR